MSSPHKGKIPCLLCPRLGKEIEPTVPSTKQCGSNLNTWEQPRGRGVSQQLLRIGTSRRKPLPPKMTHVCNGAGQKMKDMPGTGELSPQEQRRVSTGPARTRKGGWVRRHPRHQWKTAQMGCAASEHGANAWDGSIWRCVVLPGKFDLSRSDYGRWENRLTECAKAKANGREVIAEIWLPAVPPASQIPASTDKAPAGRTYFSRTDHHQCPRCSEKEENVYEGQKNFYCEIVAVGSMWKNDRFF